MEAASSQVITKTKTIVFEKTVDAQKYPEIRDFISMPDRNGRRTRMWNASARPDTNITYILFK